MHLDHLFKNHIEEQNELPPFVRSIEDIRGIRVVRLDGPVGKDSGDEMTEYRKRVQEHADFSRPLLLDFSDAKACDFTTVAFLVDALRKRMKEDAHIGIVNAPKELVAELRLAQLQGVFPIFESESEAIDTMASVQQD